MNDLRAKVQDKKAIVGTDRVLKALKDKKISKVYLARNCSGKLQEDIQYYAQLASVPVIMLGQSNEELGVFCKKNFFVSIVGILE